MVTATTILHYTLLFDMKKGKDYEEFVLREI